MMEWLTEPWQFEFMRRALIAGVFVALAGAVVGTFVVVRGLAFLSDAVAHSSLAGAAIAFVAGGGSTAISIGAVLAAVATALGIAFVTARSQIREDTAIGLFFAGLFGFAILLISSARNFALELNSFIVGNILGVAMSDLVLMGVLTVTVVAVTLFFYPELLYTMYDAEMAAASGVPVGLVRTGLLVLVALAAVVAFRLVGVVLVMAMLVAPAATAGLVVRRIPLIMALSALIGLGSVLAGLYLSFYEDLATGPAIVIVAIGVFGVVFLVTPRGLNLLLVARGAWTARSG